MRKLRIIDPHVIRDVKVEFENLIKTLDWELNDSFIMQMFFMDEFSKSRNLDKGEFFNLLLEETSAVSSEEKPLTTKIFSKVVTRAIRRMRK